MAGLLDEARPIPRGRLLGLLADGASGAANFMSAPFGYANPPGELAASLLGLPAIARTLDRASYGEPLTSGRGQTLRLLPDTMEAALAVTPAATVVHKALRNGKMLNAPDVANASKSSSLLDPKPLPQRPFSDDYPSASQSDAGSPLFRDIEGRALRAPLIAGREVSGGPDEGVALALSRQIAADLRSPAYPKLRSGPELRGDAGRYNSGLGDREIWFDKSLPLDVQNRVISHEVGHAIDDLVFGVAGKGGAKIPVDGLSKELAAVYENLNTKGWFKPGRGATPKAFGYSDAESDAERMAEAIRAYMADPNWLKTVAPKTAARIREYVNENQNINKVIQFNSAAPAAIGSGLLGGAMMLPDKANAQSR